jgi:hypothetical protein
MSFGRKTKIEVAVCTLLFGAAGIAWLSSQLRWARINSPAGKFDSSGEYLAAGRLPNRVATLTNDGTNYFIAYSPMDYRLAFPSGPAAYVFDGSGRMVSWSRDSGDDVTFQRDWPLTQQRKASIDDLRELGLKRDGGAKDADPLHH